MVTSATLIEPFTECFVAGLLGSFAFHTLLGLSWKKIYFWHIIIWLGVDFCQFYSLHCNSAVDLSSDGDKTPDFARGNRSWNVKRLGMWFVCWFIREVTCLPIWIVAMGGQSVVKWRKRKFMVRRDMTVVEIR